MTFKSLRDQLDSMINRDPAARSRLEVALCYPGFQVLVFHRAAHALWRRGWHLGARWLSQVGRIMTGIEIHPGATVGERLFIDHGMGVVIGETAEIGNDVTLYQGVTLGGTSLDHGKRHPTLEDGVIVGAGAQVLGPVRVGAGARIGSNAVVLTDVPKGVTMVGIPARMVMRREDREKKEFRAYGNPCEELPDPVARAIDSLRRQVVDLSQRLAELEGREVNVALHPAVGRADVAAGEEAAVELAGGQK